MRVPKNPDDALTMYDKEADPMGLWATFNEFDEDGSGAVSTAEFALMLESLGMAMSKADLKGMIDAADEDKSGEIEFNEFVYTILKSAAEGGTTGNGQSISSLFARQKNSVKMAWRTDRLGKDITIEGNVATYTGTTSSCALLSPWLPGDEVKCNRGSCLLEVAVSGEACVWVGVVGRNWNPEGAHWNLDFFDKASEKKNLVTACCSKNGVMRVNGVESDMSKARAFGTAETPRVQLEINSDNKDMVFNVLTPDNDIGGSVSLDQLKSEMCVAVCFGPLAPGDKCAVKLVGSSCEKRSGDGGGNKTNPDMWDDENKLSLNQKAKAPGVGANELLGD